VTLILASASSARRRVLESAGLAFEVVPANADEEAAKAKFRTDGLAPRAQAQALADLKALSVSRQRQGLVIGADQMLAIEDVDAHDARRHLELLRGKTHELLTAVAVAQGDKVIWRRMDVPRLTMRDFSDAFLADYLTRAGENALNSVGAYQLEGLGAQLFERVEGDFFSVLGLPLLPLLAFLREQGIAQQ